MGTKQRMIHHSFVPVLCVSVLAIALSVSVSGVAPAQPTADVKVVNTTSNPVPVTLQGTSSGSNNVTVTNPASNPVQTQNVGSGAATQVGQPVSKLVNLSCGPQNCTRVGGGGAAFSVPAGEALVITDLQWTAPAANPSGTYEELFVFVNNVEVTSFTALVDAQGEFGGQVHLTSGIVAPPSSNVEATTNGTSCCSTSFIQGYLVPNQ